MTNIKNILVVVLCLTGTAATALDWMPAGQRQTAEINYTIDGKPYVWKGYVIEAKPKKGMGFEHYCKQPAVLAATGLTFRQCTNSFYRGNNDKLLPGGMLALDRPYYWQVAMLSKTAPKEVVPTAVMPAEPTAEQWAQFEEYMSRLEAVETGVQGNTAAIGTLNEQVDDIAGVVSDARAAANRSALAATAAVEAARERYDQAAASAAAALELARSNEQRVKTVEGALTEQSNTLAGQETRLEYLETDLGETQDIVLGLQTTVAGKADAETVAELASRIEGLENAKVSEDVATKDDVANATAGLATETFASNVATTAAETAAANAVTAANEHTDQQASSLWTSVLKLVGMTVLALVLLWLGGFSLLKRGLAQVRKRADFSVTAQASNFVLTKDGLTGLDLAKIPTGQSVDITHVSASGDSMTVTVRAIEKKLRMLQLPDFVRSFEVQTPPEFDNFDPQHLWQVVEKARDEGRFSSAPTPRRQSGRSGLFPRQPVAMPAE